MSLIWFILFALFYSVVFGYLYWAISSKVQFLPAFKVVIEFELLLFTTFFLVALGFAYLF